MAHSLNREMYVILVLQGVLGLPINSLRDILTQTNPCCHGNDNLYILSQKYYILAHI